MEDGGDAARHGGHDPHPVSGAASPAVVFILHVLNEGLGGRVVVNDGHFVTLWEERGQGVRRKEQLGYFGTPLPIEQCFPKAGPGDDSRQVILCIVLSILIRPRRNTSLANLPLSFLLLSFFFFNKRGSSGN